MSKSCTFEVNDQKYCEINKILDQVREAYKSDTRDYTFLDKYEELLYANESDRRDTDKELKRLAQLPKSVFQGTWDPTDYEQTFSNSLGDRFLSFADSLRGKKTLRRKSLYQSKHRLFNYLKNILGHIDGNLKAVLDSNYIITKVEEVTTLTNNNDKSGFWHFDPVPLGYGKIFLYLSDKEDTDGKTYYMNIESSVNAFNKGYNNVPPDLRTKDLNSIVDNDYSTIENRGDWIIFLPGVMLHRASYPTRGTRRMLSINFLRSKYLWSEVFDEIWELDNLSGSRIASNWPLECSSN